MKKWIVANVFCDCGAARSVAIDADVTDRKTRDGVRACPECGEKVNVDFIVVGDYEAVSGEEALKKAQEDVEEKARSEDTPALSGLTMTDGEAVEWLKGFISREDFPFGDI